MYRILNCTMKYTFKFLVTVRIEISFHFLSDIIYTVYLSFTFAGIIIVITAYVLPSYN